MSLTTHDRTPQAGAGPRGTAPRATRLASTDLAEVRDVASRHAAEADRARRLSTPVVDSLVAAGFARHFVPRRHGGAAGGFLELLRAAADIAATCPSAGWCGALFAAHARLAAYLPQRAREDLWGTSADTVLAAAVAPPRVVAEPTTGGWLLTGRWAPASGVDHAEWILLSALAADPAAHPGPRLLAVPVADVTVEDTWHTTGMRGTGSNTVVLDRVFVPRHRGVDGARLLSWEGTADGARCHAVPYPLVAALIFAAPVLGAARGAVACWEELASPWLHGDAAAAADAGRALARSTGELQAATLLLENAAGRADMPELVSGLAVAENMRDCTLAVELCVSAADRLAAHALGVAGDVDGPVAARLQQLTEDVKVAATHAMLRFDPAVAGFARAAVPQPVG